MTRGKVAIKGRAFSLEKQARRNKHPDNTKCLYNFLSCPFIKNERLRILNKKLSNSSALLMLFTTSV
jgi:hypothetical protein